ncbi:MAG: ABC transporter ATP-binding protein [Bacillota bacterium]
MSDNRQITDNGGGMLLKVEHLSKRYLRAQALDDVSFELNRGSIVGLLGPNGSGKSTLLKCIAGLCRPTHGRILIDGKQPGLETKRKVAYLPEVDSLYQWMTARQAMDFAKSFYNDWDETREADLLDLVKIDAETSIKAMSKGQKARLRLVMALSRRAPLILLDEPLSGIDPPSRSRVLNAIVSEFSEEEQTIILSTHEVSEAESIFDQVIFLHKGKIRLMGDAEDIRTERNSSIQELLEEVYA